MRIGYFVPEFPGQTHIFFWREIQELRRCGEQIFLLSTAKPSAAACRHDFALSARAETCYLFPPTATRLFSWGLHGFPKLRSALRYLDQLNVSDIRERLKYYALLLSAVDLLLWSKQLRIDHIHCHSCANSAHIVALTKYLGGPTYSLTLHGDLAVYGKNHQYKMENAEFVSAVGSHLREQILDETDISEQKILLTCMGVPTTEMATLGRNRDSKAGTLHIVTVARLHPNKGHLHALAAIFHARRAGLNVTYTIAGEGIHRDMILAKINQLGLADCVRLIGTASETQVYQLLSIADAYLLPSVGPGEAWPVSVMEAMSAGLPVISSIIGATPEMIQSGVDGILVPQADERAIFESIALLANDLDLRRSMAGAARATAQTRFDVQVTSRDLITAIRAGRK